METRITANDDDEHQPSRLIPISYFRGSALHLSADANRCTECMKCTMDCPMGLDVNGMVRQISMENTECILCENCADICPNGAVHMV